MRKLLIIGAGELGRQILNLADQINSYKVIGFVDDFVTPGTEIVPRLRVIGTIKDVVSLYDKGKFDFLAIGIGYKHPLMRKKIYNEFSELIPFATLIHPSCIIDSSAIIEKGCILYAGCNIDKDVIIRDNTLLNLSVTVAHTTEVGAHSFIAPGVIFSGFVKIGECNFIGAGTIVIDNIYISDNNFIGAGTVITKNISVSGVYYGNPALLRRTIEDESV